MVDRNTDIDKIEEEPTQRGNFKDKNLLIVDKGEPLL